MKAWLNGALVDAESACVSPADHGFLLGDGVFETLRSHGGRVPTLRAHLGRLAAGARAMAIEPPPAEALEQAVLELLEASGLPDARLRVTVTSGSGPPGLSRGQAPPTVLITAAPVRRWPETATAVVAPWAHDERSPLAGVKTTSRAESVMALMHSRERGADEALFLNRAGNVCEATTANVFAVLAGTVRTPPLSAGCLAGITREQVLDLCRQLDIPAAECDLPAAALEAADELFLTSSTRGVQALVEVDGAAVGTGEPGPITRRLTDAYAALVEEPVSE